jgi:hypothetical protein
LKPVLLLEEEKVSYALSNRALVLPRRMPVGIESLVRLKDSAHIYSSKHYKLGTSTPLEQCIVIQSNSKIWEVPKKRYSSENFLSETAGRTWRKSVLECRNERIVPVT